MVVSKRLVLKMRRTPRSVIRTVVAAITVLSLGRRHVDNAISVCLFMLLPNHLDRQSATHKVFFRCQESSDASSSSRNLNRDTAALCRMTRHRNGSKMTDRWRVGQKYATPHFCLNRFFGHGCLEVEKNLRCPRDAMRAVKVAFRCQAPAMYFANASTSCFLDKVETA